ncbi:LANO_0A06084g1_1 [Lachancea nothofagi CBS 11611]|uniref:Autophagy-related protein n=1 Tax=Lachancea nothofagi CBS 11611 TaxID=1266666 RepID=A0A1G4IRJ5_9SACH|nr:LANO_0A06084g1_1 [Lachancea nothofagi CBS 11611]
MDLAPRYGSLEDSILDTHNDDTPIDKNRIRESTVPLESSSAIEIRTSVLSETGAFDRELPSWNRNQVFYAWLLVCFSTGPTSSMSKAYIPTVIQSLAHALGHKKNTLQKCSERGDDCYVRFGGGTVQYTSYVLYLKAIYTALEGLVAIFVMTFADYSNFRKWLLAVSIILFGLLACPFVALSKETWASLTAVSVLYCLMLIVETIYQIIEGSYVPIFMSAASQKVRPVDASYNQGDVALRRGAKVSALGLIMGNLGGILALIIGVIINYTSGTPRTAGFHNYLLAITIAGVMTMLIGTASIFFIPNLRGQRWGLDNSRPNSRELLALPVQKFANIAKDVWRYKEVLKFVVAWVLWNISFANYLSVNALMFRSTLGLTNSNAEYTVWQLLGNILALTGSLVWMLLYNWQCQKNSNTNNVKRIKQSLYTLLFFGWFANLWGALGANPGCKIGYKHRWEFWVGLVLFMSTSSAIRSLNRVVYSGMLPKGKENEFFGLEIMLGLLTGWSEPLLIAVISDRTGNSRMPYIPNTLLFSVAVAIYYWCDIEAGMRQVGKL